MHLARVFALASTFAVLLACGKPEPPPPVGPDPKPPIEQVAVPSACDNLNPLPESQFPAGFDYPQAPATINSWITPGGGHRVRFHAYCVFAGLNQNTSTTPTWRKWKTSTQAFPFQYNPWKPSLAVGSSGEASAAPAVRPVTLNTKNLANARVGGVGAINNPAPIYGVNKAIVDNPSYRSCLQPISGTSPQLYNLKDGTNFQSNGDIMVAAVSYNQAAITNILNTGLFNAAVLDGKLPPKDKSATSIPGFPSTSMVLKVMLWPVAGGGPTYTSVTALPIWDWDANKPGSPADGKYAGYEMQNLWTRAVAISSGPPGPPEKKRVQFLYGVLDPNGKPLGPNTYDGDRVTLDRFYSRKYTAADLASLSNCDRAILDASAYWTYNRAFQAGDSLALVAMHIMTKEPQSDWTFQSAWWHPDALACPSTPDSNRYCQYRPDSVPGGDTTYKNYMMTTTYGTTQQQGNSNYYAPPGTKGPVWPVAYNPYIELAASHPITTNCMNCHRRAAWPPLNPDQKPDKGRSSSYLQESPPNPPNPNVLETFQTSNGIFNGLAMVDSMWAVSDRAGYPTSGESAPEGEKKP